MMPNTQPFSSFEVLWLYSGVYNLGKDYYIILIGSGSVAFSPVS